MRIIQDVIEASKRKSGIVTKLLFYCILICQTYYRLLVWTGTRIITSNQDSSESPNKSNYLQFLSMFLARLNLVHRQWHSIISGWWWHLSCHLIHDNLTNNAQKNSQISPTKLTNEMRNGITGKHIIDYENKTLLHSHPFIR